MSIGTILNKTTKRGDCCGELCFRANGAMRCAIFVLSGYPQSNTLIGAIYCVKLTIKTQHIVVLTNIF